MEVKHKLKNVNHLVIWDFICIFASEIKQKSNNLKSFWNMEKNYKNAEEKNGFKLGYIF